MVTLEGAHYIVPAGAQKVGAFRVNFMIFLGSLLRNWLPPSRAQNSCVSQAKHTAFSLTTRHCPF